EYTIVMVLDLIVEEKSKKRLARNLDSENYANLRSRLFLKLIWHSYMSPVTSKATSGPEVT
ncbi:hypothetical protein ACJ72_08337, partial [Emergomyces africanus]